MEHTCTIMGDFQTFDSEPLQEDLHLDSEGIEHFTCWFLGLDPSGKDVCPVPLRYDVSLLADSVLPSHFGLLVLGCSDHWLGGLAGRGPRCGRGRGTLAVQGSFLWNTHGLGWQGGGWLMEMVERWLVGEVVGVEVLIKVVVGLEIRQSFPLVWWLRCSGQGQTQNLGLKVSDVLGWVSSSRGRLAAAGRWLGSAQDVRLRYTVPDGLVGRVQVFLVGGPGLAAGDRLQSVGATGWSNRRRHGAAKGAVTEGGDARAGAARQVGVTASRGGLWTGGRGRYRVEGRLGVGVRGRTRVRAPNLQ